MPKNVKKAVKFIGDFENTDDINLICPTNNYSSLFYSSSKNYLFLLYNGSIKKDNPPNKTIEAMLVVQTIHPKAVPTVSGMLNIARMLATKKG